MTRGSAIQKISADAVLSAELYGARASTLCRLKAAGLPVPDGYALAAGAVRGIAATGVPEDWPLSSLFSGGTLVSIRSSPVSRSWGGPETILNIGMNDAAQARLAERVRAFFALHTRI